ncbi:MAG: class I SAM-dependent methyltransferase [bacterium]
MSKVKSYMPVVLKIIEEKKPRSVLDAPSGNGWLKSLETIPTEIDGIDLYEDKPKGYRNFHSSNLELGLPSELPKYDVIVSCEGIEHIGNPSLFLESVFKHLEKGGVFVVTTPNIWYPLSKLKYLFCGFFPSYSNLIGRMKPGAHMHIMPWSFPWLYTFLKMAKFEEIKIYEVDEKKPKHFIEKIFGLPQKFYCKSKYRKSKTKEEKDFWRLCSTPESLYGRRLVMSAKRNL